MDGFDLDSMHTPSYPSGHAVQGYFIGKYYSDKYPEYANEFKKAVKAGVEVICIDTILNTKEITIGKNIKLLNK